MTIHNKPIRQRDWREVKGAIVMRFGTVKAVAAHIGCHPNAIRYATQGRCPRVARRLFGLLGYE